MELLNKQFEYKQILTSEELNDITRKVDEIASLLSSLDTGNSTITDAQIQDKVNQAKTELNSLLDAAITNVQKNILSLRDAINKGTKEVVSEEEWAQYRTKVDKTGDTLASMIQLLQGEINISSLRLTVDELNSLIGSINISPGKLELIASLFDENDNLVLPPAAIIAAIKDVDGKLTSEIAISADLVILDGDVTLTRSLTGISIQLLSLNTTTANIRGELTTLNATVNGKATISLLEAVDAKISNLNIPDTATIKNAIIEEILAGNVTITGDLRYNKLIGNVTNVVGETTLSDGAYFVDILQPTNDSEIVDLTMPLNPVTGLIIYIMYMENARSIKANVPMAIYYIDRDQNDVPSLRGEVIPANTLIDPVQREMGNQVTQFLFDGNRWVLLNAPFISYRS